MKRILAAGITTLILTSPAMAANTRIGVTMALFDDNFLTNVREAMAAQAKTMPGVEIKFEDAQADIGRQINQVQNFIAEGVSAIIVNPADTSATRSITKMVEGAGIPLVYVNREPVNVDSLPPLHKDPFDRILLSQALVEGVTLLTTDAALLQYKGPVRKV